MGGNTEILQKLTVIIRSKENCLAIVASLNHVYGNAWRYHPWLSRHGRTPLRRDVTSYQNILLRLIVLKWTGTDKNPVSEFEISDPLNIPALEFFCLN